MYGKVSYKRQFLFGLLFVVIILLIVEVVARTHEWIYPNCDMVNSEALKTVDIFYQRQMCLEHQQLLYNDFDGYQLNEPNVHKSTININSHGFRGSEFSLIKEALSYRIFMVGASTTFGSGATSDDTTIPSLLQKKFEERRPDLKVEVINAGVSAANSNTENKLIFDKIIEYDPDLLILYDGWADAWHRNEILSKIDPSHTDVSITGSKKNLGIIDFFQHEFKIYRTPVVIYKNFFWDKGTHYRGTIETQDFTQITAKIAANWKQNKLKICKFGQDENIKIAIILQPILGTGNKPYHKGEQVIVPKSQFDLETVYVLNALAKPLAELQDNCDVEVDMRNVFDNVSEPIYFDKGHMSNYGNNIVADRIFESIVTVVSNDVAQH